MTQDELAKVESQVNEKVKANVAVKWEERPYAEVKDDSTILQFFGDKYGTTVRVVDIGDFLRSYVEERMCDRLARLGRSEWWESRRLRRGYEESKRFRERRWPIGAVRR